MNIPGESVDNITTIAVTNDADTEYVGYNDDATISSDFDESVAEHAKVLLTYFHEMYKVSLFIVFIEIYIWKYYNLVTKSNRFEFALGRQQH